MTKIINIVYLLQNKNRNYYKLEEQVENYRKRIRKEKKLRYLLGIPFSFSVLVFLAFALVSIVIEILSYLFQKNDNSEFTSLSIFFINVGWIIGIFLFFILFLAGIMKIMIDSNRRKKI